MGAIGFLACFLLKMQLAENDQVMQVIKTAKELHFGAKGL